jgi:hypothetical protein
MSQSDVSGWRWSSSKMIAWGLRPSLLGASAELHRSRPLLAGDTMRCRESITLSRDLRSGLASTIFAASSKMMRAWSRLTALR